MNQKNREKYKWCALQLGRTIYLLNKYRMLVLISFITEMGILAFLALSFTELELLELSELHLLSISDLEITLGTKGKFLVLNK